MMNLRSLACRTDLIFPRYDGEITDRGHYLVVKTPDNPGFYFGNFLLFAQAPAAGDFPRWCSLFEKEFGANPLIRHKTFLWDAIGDDPGELQPFVDHGYDLEKSSVLTASSVRRPDKHWPDSHGNELTVRPLQGDADWSAVIENQIQCRQEHFEIEAYRGFKTKQMNRYRRMSEAGLGYWFGAFYQGRIVADLGVYFDGTVARFQSVETHPEFRRKGACGTLVHQASLYVLEKHGIQHLVMVADAGSHPARIYESVGFLPTEKQYAAFWYDKG